jgi:hypothetical protein
MRDRDGNGILLYLKLKDISLRLYWYFRVIETLKYKRYSGQPGRSPKKEKTPIYVGVSVFI